MHSGIALSNGLLKCFHSGIALSNGLFESDNFRLSIGSTFCEESVLFIRICRSLLKEGDPAIFFGGRKLQLSDLTVFGGEHLFLRSDCSIKFIILHQDYFRVFSLKPAFFLFGLKISAELDTHRALALDLVTHPARISGKRSKCPELSIILGIGKDQKSLDTLPVIIIVQRVDDLVKHTGPVADLLRDDLGNKAKVMFRIHLIGIFGKRN